MIWIDSKPREKPFKSRSFPTSIPQVPTFRAQVSTFKEQIALSTNTAKGDMEVLEKSIRDISEQMVSGIAFRYGKDSREYEKAGGVRTSDLIRKATLTRMKATPETAAKMA